MTSDGCVGIVFGACPVPTLTQQSPVTRHSSHFYMEKSAQNLLTLLRGDAPQPATDKLVSMAQLHRVSYEVWRYAQHNPGFLTKRQLEKLDAHCRTNALRALDQLLELTRLSKAFHDAGIAYASVKGQQLSRMLYGRHAQKESVDLDILLARSADLEKAHAVITSMGYTQSAISRYKGKFPRRVFLIAKREVDYFNPATQCRIDLHVRPGANTYLTAFYFRNFFMELETTMIDGYPIFIPPPEQYFAYLCYHGALHQFMRLGWLMDIRAYLEVKGKNLDYDKIWNQALNMGATRHMELTLILLRDWFGDEIPAPLKSRMKEGIRLRLLAGICRRMIAREAGYSMTLPGRIGKLFYMMVLLRGFSARFDWFYGIVVRIVAGWIG